MSERPLGGSPVPGGLETLDGERSTDRPSPGTIEPPRADDRPSERTRDRMLIDLALRLGEVSTRDQVLQIGAATLGETLGRSSAWSATAAATSTTRGGPSSGDPTRGARAGQLTAPLEPRRLRDDFPDVAARLAPRAERVIVLPLAVDAEPAGVIAVAWEASASVDDDARDLFATVGRLVSQRLRLMEARAREHELAQQLQLSLLPAIAPIAGLDIEYRYRPAGEGALAGGDFYDVVDLEPGLTAVVIGDVAGHGVAAAAASGEVRYLTRGMLEHTRDPAVVLHLVDKALDRSGRPMTMVTLLCALVDTEHDELRMASAGHCTPVVRRAAGSADIAPLVPAPPLGAGYVSSSAPPVVTSLPFRADDLAVFYTDGLVERRSQPIDEMVEQVRALAASHRSPPALCTRLEALATSVDGHADDVALLVVARTGEPEHAARVRWGGRLDDSSAGIRPDQKGV